VNTACNGDPPTGPRLRDAVRARTVVVPPTGMVRSWPLLVLAMPAAVAVWSGWVGMGQMTGFGVVRPLPGIWNTLQVDTAVTLPVGVEAYAAMALRAWLTSSRAISARTRRFAMWSAIGALALGVAGQVAYHLLAEGHVTQAPWEVTTLVASLPVVVLGFGTALAHLLNADSAAVPESADTPPVVVRDHPAADQAGVPGPDTDEGSPKPPGALLAGGERISWRSLRAAGIRGSNAELGELARRLRAREPLTDRPAA
jgi:hypothetical protein